MTPLFTPLKLRGTTLENRIALPAMVTRLSGEDGVVNDDIVGRYVRYAKGEAGLVIVEAMAVHESKSGPLLRINSDEFKPGLTRLATECHAISPSRIFPQIIHFLKISRSGWRQTVDMLSPADIDGIVDAYGRAAIRARECGFDGVELHMAHAYTLSSFLSRLNPRRDSYGGSLENRLRLPLRVVDRVRASVGSDFTVGVRFVGDECIRGGYTVQDAGPIAVRLAQAGLDYISLSAGGKFEDARVIEGEPLYPYTGYSGDRCMPGSNFPDGANLYIPRAVRAALRAAGLETPVIAAGKIGTLAMAEEVLRSGDGDLVGMARSLLADPDIPKKWRSGNEARVVRCVYGNVCKALDENFKRVDCTLWPKKSGVAPDSNDTIPPVWPEGGARLTAEEKDGRILLRWTAATDNEAIYGYQVFCNDDPSDPGEGRHLASVRALSTRFEDPRAMAGTAYRYSVRPYDLAGNRGPSSNVAAITMTGTAGAPSLLHVLQVAKDPAAIDGCVSISGGT